MFFIVDFYSLEMGNLRRTKHIPPTLHQGRDIKHSHQIHILGPFNSGTNLLASLLQGNLRGARVGGGGVWKHTLDEDAVSLLQNNRRNIILMMHRPLASWIAGVQKTPYDLVFLADGTVSFRNRVYPSVVDLYHAYSKMYTKILQRADEKHSAVLIDYFRLLHPEDGFNYLNAQLKKAGAGFLRCKGHYFKALMRPAKDHGSPVQDYQQALEKRKEDEARVNKWLESGSMSINDDEGAS